MKTLTGKEGEALLALFKDFAADYNANSLSKKLSITPRGTLKILKNLYSEKLLIKKQMGKAAFYKVNLDDAYANKLVETLLIKESREKASRWLAEFEGLFGKSQIALIYGSAIRDYDKAKDIDLLIVIDKEKYKEASKWVDEKNNTSFKPLHGLIMTLPDLEQNLRDKNPAMINALREGYTLSGYEPLIEVIKNVTSF